jgi:cell division septation protein DedD
LAQDDYYYEIQLTNKQLVFYFMAGATGLILSFLAGVMVGKGVDATAGDVQAARPVLEDRVVAEEPALRATTPPPAEELTYAQRLEGERPEEAVLEPKASVAEARPAPSTLRSGSAPTLKPVPAPAKPAPAKAAPTPKPAPATTRPAPKPAAKTGPGSTKPGLHAFTIQVGAFKDRAAAESVVTRLKGKGFAAYLVTPESPGGGLYNVRVGSYPARVDAERVQTKLRDEEKFKPFIVEN